MKSGTAGGGFLAPRPSSRGSGKKRVRRVDKDFVTSNRGDDLLLLLLLLSRCSRVRLCAAAHQTPPFLGFSREQYWKRLPFPSPMGESEVVPDSYATKNQTSNGSENWARVTVSRREDPTQAVRESERKARLKSPRWSVPVPDAALDPETLRASPSGGPGTLP